MDIPGNRGSIGQFTSNDVNFGKYFKAVQGIGKLVMHRVVRDLLDSEPGQKDVSIEEFILKKLGWTKNKLRQSFKSDLYKLQVKTSSTNIDWDVSFCFKIVREVFNIPDTLLEKLRILKNCRNILCHEETTINDDELLTKMEELKSIVLPFSMNIRYLLEFPAAL